MDMPGTHPIDVLTGVQALWVAIVALGGAVLIERAWDAWRPRP